MKLVIVKWLEQLLLWLNPPAPPAPPSPLQIAAEAAVLRVEANSAVGTSGEYKRHQVYAKLLKKFPDLPKRDIGLAIELAVHKVL